MSPAFEMKVSLFVIYDVVCKEQIDVEVRQTDFEQA